MTRIEQEFSFMKLRLLDGAIGGGGRFINRWKLVITTLLFALSMLPFDGAIGGVGGGRLL